MFEGNFLGRLPRCLNLHQRLSFEALNFCFESTIGSYNSLRNGLASYPTIEDVGNMLVSERVHAFTLVWSIIDQCYALNQLLKEVESYSIPTELPEGSIVARITIQSDVFEPLSNFYKEYSPSISHLRNKMDHLRDNLANMSIARKRRPPVFGALSYMLMSEEKLMNNRAEIVSITVGSFTHEKHTIRMLNPCDYAGKELAIPVDLIQFEAFDSRINMTSLYDDLVLLRKHFNTVISDLFEEKIKHTADEIGISYEEAFKINASSITIAAEISFATEEA